MNEGNNDNSKYAAEIQLQPVAFLIIQPQDEPAVLRLNN